MSGSTGTKGNELQELRERLASLEHRVAGIPARFAQLRPGFRHITMPADHGLGVGTVMRNDGTAWVTSQADAEDHAYVGGLIVSVPTPRTLVIALPGTYVQLPTLTLTPGINFLAATAGGTLTTTAPTLKVPVLMADSATSGIVMAGAAGGGATPPSEDGTVWCAKADLSGGEWVMVIDVGRNATGKAGKIQILSPNAGGVAVEIDAALVTGAGQKLTIREEDACDNAGAPKKRKILASDLY